ncbi:MAG: DUF4249 domain-containing protein [Bacteroidota bacterium]|nr:DUF4249 domain-containing protein [Bacteroidota bacterium]
MRTLLTAFAILFLFTGCVKNVEMDLPDNESLLVVNSFFNPGDTWQVNVSKSRNMQQRMQNVDVENARVTLYEDGVLLDTMRYTSGGNYVLTTHKPVPGKTYTLKVSAPGFPDVESEQRLESRILIESLTYDYINDPNGQGMQQPRLKIKFTDVPSQKNYYQIVVSSMLQGPFGEMSRECIFSEDPVVDAVLFDNCNGLLFDDNLFEGRSYELAVPVGWGRDTTGGTGEEMLYQVELRTLTEAMFEYQRTYSLQKNSEGDPFAQPVQVYNNITSGYGVFGGFRSDMDSIVVK